MTSTRLGRLTFGERARLRTGAKRGFFCEFGPHLLGALCALAFCASVYSLVYQSLRDMHTPAAVEFSEAHQDERVPALHPATGVPMRLRINGEMWELVFVDHFSDSHYPDKPGHIQAETQCSTKRILYLRHDDPAMLRSNLMHEVFHAGACLHGGDAWWNSVNPTSDVHPGIYHLGEFMSGFAAENPLFMTWVAERE